MSNNLSTLPVPAHGVIGHRGAPQLAPENTLSSFVKAAQQGHNWIEFDVQPCQTGEWVVFHDETLERTSNGTGHIADTSLTKLRQLDAGSWFDNAFCNEPIPLFSEALECLLANNCHPNVEIKTNQCSSLDNLTDFLELIHQHWPNTQPYPLVSSSDLAILEKLRSLSPTLPLGYVVSDQFTKRVQEVLNYGLDSLHCHYSMVNKHRQEEAKQLQVPLLIYTVNRLDDIQSYCEEGAFAVFSDLTCNDLSN